MKSSVSPLPSSTSSEQTNRITSTHSSPRTPTFELPPELLTTTKFYSYLNTLGNSTDPSCFCNQVIDLDTSNDSFNCLKCNGVIPILAKQSRRIQFLESKLASLSFSENNHKQEIYMIQQKNQLNVEGLREQIETLDQERTKLQGLLATTQKDMEVLGEKLLDEIDIRAELAHSKDTFHDELEELTQTLFEEANVLVSTEAKKVHKYKVKEKKLTQELESVREQWSADVLQLRELREMMAHQEEVSSVALSGFRDTMDNDQVSLTSLLSSQEPIAYDPAQFNSFKVFIQSIKEHNTVKINSNAYIKQIYEEDVIPVLSFPLASTRKLVEAISNNSFYIERISARRESTEIFLKLTQPHQSLGKQPIPPTSLVFAKSLSERFNLFTSFQQSIQPSIQPSTEISCSTCGRCNQCTHHFKTTQDPDDTWFIICDSCRKRISAVCDYYGFIRALESHIFHISTDENVFEKLLFVRSTLFCARVGVSTNDLSRIGKSTSRTGVKGVQMMGTRSNSPERFREVVFLMESPTESPLVKVETEYLGNTLVLRESDTLERNDTISRESEDDDLIRKDKEVGGIMSTEHVLVLESSLIDAVLPQ